MIRADSRIVIEVRQKILTQGYQQYPQSYTQLSPGKMNLCAACASEEKVQLSRKSDTTFFVYFMI